MIFVNTEGTSSYNKGVIIINFIGENVIVNIVNINIPKL